MKRRATRLDKVRWLLIYTTDFMLLLVGFGAVQLWAIADLGRMPWWLAIVGMALIVAFYALSTRPFRIAVKGGPRPTLILVVTGLITLVLALPGVLWTLPVWLALMAPFVRRRTLAFLIAGCILPNAGLLAFVVDLPTAALVLVIQVAATTLIVGGMLANLWLWRIAEEAHEGEEARARLAVAEERLRFARDLSDLVGRSLADVSAKTALAESLLSADPDAAAAEMFDVRDLARSSLREVRTAVQNYRALDLDEVLASVRAVLEAADVHCVVEAETADLPAETRTLLASVVREGATNILKHSTASRCRITIKDGVLEMTNDGVGSAVRETASGLKGLAQRMSAAGGDLSAAPAADGTFLLRAAVRA